jgi:hypothetical protein
LKEAPPTWTKDGEEEEVEEQQLPWLSGLGREGSGEDRLVRELELM